MIKCGVSTTELRMFILSRQCTFYCLGGGLELVQFEEKGGYLTGYRCLFCSRTFVRCAARVWFCEELEE